MRWILAAVLCTLCATASGKQIYRCEDRAGRQVFSDQPCRAIDALPLPSIHDPAPRPAAPPIDEVTEASDEPVLTDDLAQEPPAAAAGCPGPTPQALGDALVAAAARRDLNAIAGMYHWPSAGAGASRRVFAEARRLSDAAPLSFAVLAQRADDSWLWRGDPPPPAANLLPPELIVLEAGEAARQLGRFTLIRHAGCFWLPA